MTRNNKHIELTALRRQPAEHEHEEQDIEEQTRQTVNLQTAEPSSQTVSQTQEPSVAPISVLPAIVNDQTRKAEVRFALHLVETKSFLNAENVGPMFKNTFSDSSITAGFSLGKTKAMYLIKFGLCQYFEQLLRKMAR